MLIDVKECARWLLENDEYVLVCHRDPDGDSFGSATALADALLNIGKKVKIECPTEFPENLTFLKKDYENFEAKFIVGIDTAAPNMFGDKDVRPNHIDLVIDHHPTNPDYADRTWLVNYAATGEAVFELLKEMKVNISPFAATAMFCAMSADTGGFNFANTTQQTHRYAADLMDLKADFNLVRKKLFESNSIARVMTQSNALSKMRLYENGQISVISISLEEAKKYGVKEEELEGIPSEVLKINGVHIAITLKEREDNIIRVSVRSDEDKYDSSRICRAFEGGGHIRAAGCRLLNSSLEEAEKRLVEQAKKEL